MEGLILQVPEFLNENKEINAFFDAVEPELLLLESRLESLRANILPETADSTGIKHYEEWLGIPYNRTLSLEDRRIEVLARLNETLPFTEIRLQRFLAAAVGWDNFTYKREGPWIQVELFTEDGNGVRAVRNMLHRVVPLNCHFDLIVNHVHEEDKLLLGVGTIVEEIIETKALDDKLRTATVYLEDGTVVSTVIETEPVEDVGVTHERMNVGSVITEIIETPL